MLQLLLELRVPVVGVVAVPGPVEDGVVRREVGRVGVGAGLRVGRVRGQQAAPPEAVSELLPTVVTRIARLGRKDTALISTTGLN